MRDTLQHLNARWHQRTLGELYLIVTALGALALAACRTELADARAVEPAGRHDGTP